MNANAEKRTLTCINCPIGCRITAELENGVVAGVTGNQCGRGAAYAKTELTNPVRMMTSTVRLRHGVIAQLPVKTKSPIPKQLITDSVRALANIELDAPVARGQVILQNICGTGVDVIATRTVGNRL